MTRLRLSAPLSYGSNVCLHFLACWRLERIALKESVEKHLRVKGQTIISPIQFLWMEFLCNSVDIWRWLGLLIFSNMVQLPEISEDYFLLYYKNMILVHCVGKVKDNSFNFILMIIEEVKYIKYFRTVIGK